MAGLDPETRRRLLARAIEQRLFASGQQDPRMQVWMGPLSEYATPEVGGMFSTSKNARRQLADYGVDVEDPMETRARMLRQKRNKQGIYSDEHVMRYLGGGGA